MFEVPAALRGRLGVAIAKRTYKAYRALLGSPRWQRITNAGGKPQRLLWAAGGSRDFRAADALQAKALAAPFTVNTTSETTLKALAGHSQLDAILPADGGDCEEVLSRFTKAGIDIDAMAAKLQEEDAASSVQSWKDLMAMIASKSGALRKVG
jgi:transaldolase